MVPRRGLGPLLLPAAVLLRSAALPRQSVCQRHACRPLLGGRTASPTYQWIWRLTFDACF